LVSFSLLLGVPAASSRPLSCEPASALGSCEFNASAAGRTPALPAVAKLSGAERVAGAAGGETTASVVGDVRPQAPRSSAAAATAPPTAMRFIPADTLAAAAEKSNHQRCDEQHQEDEEQNLGDLGGAGGDSAEAEDSRNNRHDKKYQCVVEHFVILSARSRAHIE